jgi:hypothetical protein
MAGQYSFEVRMTGKDFRVALVSPKEVADFITSVEGMIVAIVARDNPGLSVRQEDVILGLSSITLNSLHCEFISNYEIEVKNAVALSSEAVKAQEYDELPAESINALKAIRKFAQKHETQAEVWEHNGHDEQLAVLTPQTRIQPPHHIIKEYTTFYGTIRRIGGDNPPRAWMRFHDGKSFSCRVQTLALARTMAKFLYERVGVSGVAQWDIRNMSLYEFRIEELLDYRQTPVKEAMNHLRDAIGDYYDDIEDVEAYIAELRGNDELDE